MKHLMIATVIFASGLAGCGVEEAIRRNDDRYARPGAMDSPLTGIYNTYQFHLLDRYRVTHQWTQSGCGYLAGLSLGEISLKKTEKHGFVSTAGLYLTLIATSAASNI